MELMVLGAFPSSLLFAKRNEGRFPPLAFNINDLAASLASSFGSCTALYGENSVTACSQVRPSLRRSLATVKKCRKTLEAGSPHQQKASESRN